MAATDRLFNRRYMTPVRPAGYIAYAQNDPGIVFKRHTYEWVLPAAFQPHLKYNPSRLPVVQHYVIIRAEYTVVWEFTGTRFEFDRIVIGVARSNEEYYLRMSIHRIKHGHRAFTP